MLDKENGVGGLRMMEHKNLSQHQHTKENKSEAAFLRDPRQKMKMNQGLYIQKSCLSCNKFIEKQLKIGAQYSVHEPFLKNLLRDSLM